tara:strand:- start:414 stop:1049 length:636 start_codon:yes stop_codon:yes gene_type:complete
MSELEFAGVKFRGGKLAGILIALSTLIGGAYGAFEVYKDYMDMKDMIQAYEPPDLSGFQEQLSVSKERIDSLENIVQTQLEAITIEVGALKDIAEKALDDSRDIKSELRDDLNNVLDEIAAVDKRSRTVSTEIRTSIRNSENTIRNIIANNESRISDLVESSTTRFSAKRDQIESDFTRKSEAIDTKLIEMEDRINKTLERYFNNPLLKGD